jgi:hypothetical protein
MDITITQNADGIGTITIAGVPITPYVAPVSAPVAEPVSVPAPTPTPAQSATVTAAFADGKTATLSLQPGERLAFIAGDVTRGSAVFHADGRSVCIENCYMGTTGPLAGTFTVMAWDTAVFQGALKIGAYKREVFWLAQPEPKATPDWSAWPRRAGGEQASMYDAFAASNTGPGGIGIACKTFETTGERPDLGGPLWDVAQMTNPTAKNAQVVRGMGDVAARWGVHVIDIATNEMVDLSTNPYISMAGPSLGKNGNPIIAWTDDSSGLSLSQAQAHATYYGAAAAELYDTDFDREEVGFWAAYYGSLWQNPAYRSAHGGTTFKSCQVRGKARCMEYLLLATKYASAKWQPLFTQWIRDAIADGTVNAKAQTGLAIDQITGQSGAEANLYSVWNQQILVAALGRALDFGFTEAQWLLDYYAAPVLDSVLGDGQLPAIGHEFASGYKYPWIKPDGSHVANYREVCELHATTDAGFAAALTADEDSDARIKALEPTDSKYVPGDFDGYPWSPTGFPCFVRVALVALVNHATDQVRAQAALKKFTSHYRADHSHDAKYNWLPRAA